MLKKHTIKEGMEGKKNLVIIDSNEKEGEQFLQGVRNSTGKSWELLVKTNNDRSSFVSNFIRYLKYALVPLRVFIHRKDYETIIAWQQFYGLFFAFYCTLFRVHKVNKLIVMTFIYKEKKGLLGKLYRKFFDYVVHGGYIDGFTCVAKVECKKFSKLFNLPINMFHYVRWGLADFSKDYNCCTKSDKYIFSAGRSNRDWDFLFNALGNTAYNGIMVCSEGNYHGKYVNLEVLKNISDDEYYQTLAESFCVVLSTKDCTISAGQITLIQAMQFGKPVILTQSEGLTNDYVVHEENGLIVNKDVGELLTALERLYSTPALYEKLSYNGRKLYEENFSNYRLGEEIGSVAKGV